MDNKVAIIIAVAVTVVLIGGGIAIVMAVGNYDIVDNDDVVTYHGNGEKTSGGAKTITYASTEVASGGIFTSSTKYFLAWNTEDDGAGTYYYPGDSVSLGTSLYAIWSDHCLDATGLNFSAWMAGLSMGISDEISGEGKTRTMEYPMGICDSGTSTIILTGCSDATKVDDNTFSGTDGAYTYHIKLKVTGADTYTLSVSGTTVYLAFTYSGDVTIGATYSSSNV